ncbi:SDR family oxidoreductase [Mesorhizobium sp. M0518]
MSGSSHGLGKSLATCFGRLGAKIALSLHNIEELMQAEAELAEGISVTAIRADVRSHDDCRALISGTVDQFGQIDVTVCNAGIDIIEPAHSYEEPEWDEIVEPFCVATTIVPSLPPRQCWNGRSIIIITTKGQLLLD